MNRKKLHSSIVSADLASRYGASDPLARELAPQQGAQPQVALRHSSWKESRANRFEPSCPEPAIGTAGLPNPASTVMSATGK